MSVLATLVSAVLGVVIMILAAILLFVGVVVVGLVISLLPEHKKNKHDDVDKQ